MCSISDIPIVGAAVNHISEATVGAASRGIRYVLYYKDNVDKLNSEIDGLNIKEREIKREVEQAENNGKEIKEHVSKWQADVKAINDEVTEVLEQYNGRTSWRCLNVLRCPNPYRRFQLGRWAAKKITMIREFSDLEKKQLGGEISYFPPKEYSPISSTEYQDFGSREGAYKKILEALSCKEDGFPVVGIYGFGGVGKTRMMEEASKEVQAKGIFNTVARANVGQVVDIGKIQDQLATYLNITEKFEDRAYQLKKRLSKGDKILVILDDVWSEIPFPEIGIHFGDSSIKGCKILLTSRLQDVCIDNNCKEPVKIEALTEEEAWDMFTKTVGNSTIESVRESFAREVCHKCARLPLIIAAVGKALHNKRQDSWEDALHQLINCKPENIPGIPPDAYACLRLSFNILHEDAYLCLLLCSLFGEDADIEIESLFRLATGSGLLKGWKTLEEARSRVSAMVDVLKSSSLLLEGLSPLDDFKLHDIIRDVARSITAKDPEYAFLSESCHSLWPKVSDLSYRKLIYLDFKSHIVDFPDIPVCPELHTLHLSCSNLSVEQLPDSFFEAFPNLECLSLHIKSLSAVPLSIQKLNRLRCLTIYGGEVIDISPIIELKNLEMLRLGFSSLRGLLLDLGRLRRLRMLDLRGSSRLEIMGNVLSGLLYLEELYFPAECNILDAVTKKKTNLSSVLSKLTLLTSLEIYFEDVKSCSDENFFKNLCRYNISVGGNVLEGKHYLAIKSVSLCDDSVEGGVKTLVERGDDVILTRVTGLHKSLCQGGGAFTDLKRLQIRKCMDAEYLFRIHQRVGSTARYLQQLEDLRIYDCKMMEEIVRNEGQIEEGNEIIDFPKLRFLRLHSLPALKSFCGKKRNIPSIATTEAASTPVCTLFDGMVTFTALRDLVVSGLDDIHTLFCTSPARYLQQLEDLTIHGCKMMEEIVRNEGQIEEGNEIIDFPKLIYLSLGSLPALKSFCGQKRNIPSIATTEAASTPVCTLFDGMVTFTALRQLVVRGLDDIHTLFCTSTARYLQQLEDLEIYDCKMMEEIVRNEGQIEEGNEIIDFPKLRTLKLVSLPALKSFCGKKRNIPSIATTEAASTPVCTLFDGMVTFTALRELVVSGLDDIHTLFCTSTARYLQQLEDLNISSCKRMEEIVRNEGQIEEGNEIIDFPKLRTLTLHSLPALKSFCGKKRNIPSIATTEAASTPVCTLFDGMFTFTALRKLVVIGLDDIHTLFCSSTARYLQQLEDLYIDNCKMMEEIVRKEGQIEEGNEIIDFPKLSTLTLDSLPALKSFCGKKRNIPSIATTEAASTPVCTLFDGMVTFTALRQLVVRRLDDIHTLFCTSIRKYLPQLEGLIIYNCKRMEEIVRNEGQIEEGNEIIDFPKLISLSLGSLPALKSFCGKKRNIPSIATTEAASTPVCTLFDGMVTFTALRDLVVRGLDDIHTLFCTSTARYLQQLEYLTIHGCKMMEEIVRNEGQIEEGNEIIDFPKLRFLRLHSLPALKSFCGKKRNIPSIATTEAASTPVCTLFDGMVVFPTLESLDIEHLDNIREIWKEKGPLEKSFCQLKFLTVSNCHKLKSVIPYAMHQRLQKLEIGDCVTMNEIITSAGKDDKEICLNNIEFSMLKRLSLTGLPIMNSFWGYGIIESNLEQQQSSARKVFFPSLEDLTYEGLTINLEEVINLGGVSTPQFRALRVSSTDSQAPQFIPPNWLLASTDLEILSVRNCWFHERDLFGLLGNSNPSTISFPRLREVEVDSCKLSTIFTYSVAKTLQQLETIKVKSCGSIQEIVTDDQRVVANTNCEEILFPLLNRVELEYLPNLKSFCTSANCCFKIPSLRAVHITRCPQMLSFTPRQISTPEVSLSVTYQSLDGKKRYSVEKSTTDINNYLQQIVKTQEFVDKETKMKPNLADKGKSIVIDIAKNEGHSGD